MRFNRSPLCTRTLLLVALCNTLLLVCLVSSASAAFKYSPRSAAGRSSVDSDGDSEEVVVAVASSIKASPGGGGSVGKKGLSSDYVFAKVSNPKLVRPRSKNSRTEEDGDDDDDDDNDYERSDSGGRADDDVDVDDDDDDNSSEGGQKEEENDENESDLEEIEAIVRRRGRSGKNEAKKSKVQRKDDRENENDGDANRSENVDESREKNKKGKKVKHRSDDADDDDDEDGKQVVVEKAKKKVKSKHDDRKEEDDDDDDNEKQMKKKKKQKDKEKNEKKDRPIREEDKDDDEDNLRSKKDSKKKKKSNKKDGKEDEEEEQKETSPWWDPFGWFGTGKDEEGFLELIQKKRDEENAKIKKQNEVAKKKQDAEEKEAGKSWLSYLNRKPFNFFFDFVGDDGEEEQSEDEKHDTEPEKGDLEMKRAKKRTGPLSTDDFEEILAYIPSFVPNYTSIENIDCRRQGQIFHRQLRGQKLWAFQMIDAGGKIGSGILHGNINQLGNFDLCTDISTKVKITEDTMVRVKGKYCLAHLDIQATDENLKYLMHLINGKSLLRSTINDPSHFVPRFTTFQWGVCVPSACTVEDVQKFLEASLEDYNSTGIRLNIEIDEENCYVAQKVHWEKLLKENYEIVGILACVSSVLVVVVLATLNQCWNHWQGANIVIEILDGNTATGPKDGEDEEIMISLNGSGGEPEPHGLLNALILQFSLKQTWSQLTTVKEGEIECLHGIKAIASIGLFSILKVLQLVRAPYSNRVDLTEILNSPWTLLIRSPVLFMDILLILSGFLTSYSILKRFADSGKFHFVSSIFGKLVRMLPLIALTTLFQAHIWPHLGSGPQWNEIVGTNSKLCAEKWWKNLLFVQTADKIEDSCDPVSYQFAVQMGLFLMAPGIIWVMHKRPHIGLGLFGAFNALSVAMRFSQTQSNRLAPVFYHGIKMTQIYRTMDMDHGSIVHRATPFINGLGLGFVVIEFGRRVKIPRSSNLCLWIISLLGLLWCLFSQTHVTKRDYIYDAVEMAQFAAWVPLIWSYSIMWIIFACFSGNGKYVNKFLSTKPFVFISRISFALHFVQFIVLSSVSAKTRAVGHFEVSNFVNTFELCVILLASVFLALTFDLPMQNVRDLLKHWEWSTNVTEETDVGVGEESANNKKSSEALFRSNGNLDSSHFDWNKAEKEEEETMVEREDSPPEKRVLGSLNSQRTDREEHLDTYGNGEEYEEEEEEYEEDGDVSGEEREGGNCASTHEVIEDIWGSDNE